MSVMPGQPDRMSFLQATNQLNTFAKESGGMHYPMTFESEIPGYLQSINALLRSQYSLSYDLPAPARARQEIQDRRQGRC